MTNGVVEAYYESWRRGVDSFDERRLAELLDEDLEFEGPIAGRRAGSAGFIAGLRRFVEGLREPITPIQHVATDGGAAVLYDASIPGGRMRFAEFFEVEGGRITSLKLVYDAAQYRELGGR